MSNRSDYIRERQNDIVRRRMEVGINPSYYEYDHDVIDDRDPDYIRDRIYQINREKIALGMTGSGRARRPRANSKTSNPKKKVSKPKKKVAKRKAVSKRGGVRAGVRAGVEAGSRRKVRRPVRARRAYGAGSKTMRKLPAKRRMASIARGRVRRRTTRLNPWIMHVKQYAKKHNVPYGVAMMEARHSYRG